MGSRGIQFWRINDDYCYRIKDGKLFHARHDYVTEDVEGNTYVDGDGFVSSVGVKLKTRLLFDEIDVRSFEYGESLVGLIDDEGLLFSNKELPVCHVNDLLLGYLSGMIESEQGVWRWQDGIAVNTDEGIIKVVCDKKISNKQLEDFKSYMAKLKLAGIKPSVKKSYVPHTTERSV